MDFMDCVVKELKPEYVGLAMCLVQRFGSWYRQEMSGLRHFSQESVQECGRWCEESSRMYLLQREDHGLVSLPPMVAARTRKLYLPSFGMEGAALENIVGSKIESKNCQSAVETE